jgi:UDP-N-acetylglucosamine 2-epimerase (hydrolysing)
VANQSAAERLRQLGECPERVFVVGSPDIDVMLSDELPSLEEVRLRYDIAFDHYAIVLLHPVTTELDQQKERAEAFVEALLSSGRNYVVIYPNNDEGSDQIFESYRVLEDNSRFRIFPSLRFEYFLTLLKHAEFIIGNSSAGIREAPVYGVPTINVGSRQNNRFRHESILEVEFDRAGIAIAIEQATTMDSLQPCHYFGKGNSAAGFLAALKGDNIWNTSKQKPFNDLPAALSALPRDKTPAGRIIRMPHRNGRATASLAADPHEMTELAAQIVA